MLAQQTRVQDTLANSLDYLLEGCQIISFDFRYLYVNTTVAKQGKSSKKELLGHTMMEMYPGIEKTEFFAKLRDCMINRKLSVIENEFIFPDGSKKWFELRIEPVPEGVIIFSIDINAKKATETKLRKTYLQDEVILESIGEGLIVTDQYGKTTMINRAAQEMLGYIPEEVLGQQVITWLSMQDESGHTILNRDRPLSLVLNQSKPLMNITSYYIRKNKDRFPVNITITPIIIEGKLTGIIEVFRDISKEKAIDKAKTEFVSVASHALRTPLGIAKWYLEAISGEKYLHDAPDILINYLDEIYKNNERLLVLVRNLLSVSRIDQGKIKDVPKKIDVIEHIKLIVKDMQIAALKDHVSIILTIKHTDFPPLYIDPLRFREVLENLITNAIKYDTKNKPVEVIVDKKTNLLSISVKDQGIGISEEDKKKIFSKFFRAEKAISNNTEGSGLGLYVTKSYVEGWNGSITLLSKENKGSTFTIHLPIAPIPKT